MKGNNFPDILKVIDTKLDINKLDKESELEHYGVKGMKWGVRRTQAQLDRAAGRKPSSSSSSKSSVKTKSGSKKKTSSSRSRTSTKSVTGRKISEMSDDELRRIADRITLERRVEQLTTVEKKTAVDRVKKMVEYAQLANNAVNTGAALYKNAKFINDLLVKSRKG